MGEQKQKRIGVLDSGLGGLTVVRELERLLPQEGVVYFGDNANCPYGNRPKEEILELTIAMLDFLQKKDIKIAAIACNTISALVDQLRKRYEFPIVSIIEEACKYTADLELSQVGVFATEFTIQQGVYEKLLKKLKPEIRVFGQSSRTLAALVDEGRFSDSTVKAEVGALLAALRQAHPDLKQVVLGCTHYPIVQDLFEEAAPGLSFINPAQVQAKAVGALLSEAGLLTDIPTPRLDIFTSGERSQYEAALKKLDIRRPVTVSVIK